MRAMDVRPVRFRDIDLPMVLTHRCVLSEVVACFGLAGDESPQGKA